MSPLSSGSLEALTPLADAAATATATAPPGYVKALLGALAAAFTFGVSFAGARTALEQKADARMVADSMRAVRVERAAQLGPLDERMRRMEATLTRIEASVDSGNVRTRWLYCAQVPERLRGACR